MSRLLCDGWLLVELALAASVAAAAYLLAGPVSARGSSGREDAAAR